MNNLQKISKSDFSRKILRNMLSGAEWDKPVTVAGITFPNYLGLAAGFDKDARYVDQLAALGFGHIEIGTVTPKPQPGNDKPRLFRLTADEALINRMGFNNQGADVAGGRLSRRKEPVIIGGNIGKNKITPNEQAATDYLLCFKKLYGQVDYFTVNVSSPNTPNLRELQDKKPLSELLTVLVEERKLQAVQRPIFLKIAPDLTVSQLDDIIDIVFSTGIDGVVASNTTINREGLKTSAATLEKIGMGGLSGKPLTGRSEEVIRHLHQQSGGKFPIIGVGGIHTADDAKRKMDAGAALVQLYTGFIYKGPGLVKEIKKGLYNY